MNSPRRTHFSSVTYLMTIVYMILFALMIFFLITDDTNTIDLRHHFIHAHKHERAPHKKTQTHLKLARTALRKVWKDHSLPLRAFIGILIVAVIMAKLFSKFILDQVEARWWFTRDTKRNRKVNTRTITKTNYGMEKQHPMSNYICSDAATNELTSTFQGSFTVVAILSFLYGSLQYLAVIFII